MKKRSAIIRIIIWSSVLVLLTGILGTAVIARTVFDHRTSTQELVLNVTTPKETIIVDADSTSGTPFEHTAKVTEQTNVHSAPNQNTTVIATLYPGDAIQASRYELVNDEKWVYITAPTSGWILGKYMDLDPKNADVPSVTAQAPSTSGEEKYGFGMPADGIREIKIEWVAGDITIEPAIDNRITVEETLVSDEAYQMVHKVSGDKLTIRFCEEKLLERGFGISLGEEIHKNLTIRIPKSVSLNSLDVDAASATMTVKNLVIQEVDFDGASGTCTFENCAVEELDVDTASGDVTFTGTLQELDCDAASSSVRAVLDNVPRSIDMDSMSGDLDLTLPDFAGFTVAMDAMSSDFISDFDTTVRNGNYVCGDGSCRIDMDAMSGDVYIRRAMSATAVAAPEATTAP